MAMPVRPEPEGARRDVFKNCKPYYSTPILECRDNVPTLFALSVNCVFKQEIAFSQANCVPTVLKNRLHFYKKYEEFKGPKIYKCSECGKFYTEARRFDAHSCSKLSTTSPK